VPGAEALPHSSKRFRSFHPPARAEDENWDELDLFLGGEESLAVQESNWL
jgi:hypothetical protein